MLLVQCPEALKLAKTIDQNDLFTDNGTPIEFFHHITVRYGINEYDPMKMQDLLGQEPIIHSGEPAIEKVGYFENVQEGACDCVYLEIGKADCKILERFSKKIEQHFDCDENRFKEFKAHITIAYVKKGKGKKIANTLNGQYKKLELGDFALQGSTLFYSDGDRREATIYLGDVI